MKALFLALTIALASVSAFAQCFTPDPAAVIEAKLERLENPVRVLMIAAHPDDENTALLAYLANVRRFRVAYLTLTRGEGGQNLGGPEQGQELARIRTAELLSARRIDGAEQLFGRAPDFGYSKSVEETFRFWNREHVLGDIVGHIRRYKPQIIVTRFPVTGEGGHGHHTASAILAEEAFDVAADPKRFPEHGRAWSAERLLYNVLPGTAAENTGDLLTERINEYLPAFGKSVGELAAESRSMHKSQGMGTPATLSPITEHFLLRKGSATRSPFDLKHPGHERHLPRAQPMLFNALSKLGAGLPEGSIERDGIAEILLSLAGARLEVTSDREVLGSEAELRVQVLKRVALPLELGSVELPGGKTIPGGPELLVTTFVRGLDRLQPESLTVTMVFRAGPLQFSKQCPVLFHLVDPMSGDRYQTVRIARAQSSTHPLRRVAAAKDVSVGYIRGAGDYVPQVLEQIGYPVSLIEDPLVAPLDKFDTIVTGVRAFNTLEDPEKMRNMLLDFVKKGGTLLVQYNTPLEFSPGPFPISLSKLRVANEASPVTLRESTLFKRPNSITAVDFENWVQERGLYFPGSWDPRYDAPISVNDPGETPLDGGILVASYGSGRFIYTSLSFFRQLPAGNLGATRLFSNMVSYGH